jgi:hypothetical protein
MAQLVKTYQKCFQCSGTGQQTTGAGSTGSGPFSCVWPGCVDGYIEIGNTELDPGLDEIGSALTALDSRLDDIVDKIDDVKDAIEGL